MKIKEYEKKTFILTIVVILWIIELVFIVCLYNYKIYNYIEIDAIVLKKDLVLVMPDHFNKKLLHQNKLIFYKDKERKYEILEDHGIILKRKNKKYYELLLKIPLDKEKENDAIKLVIKKKKFESIKLFKFI